MKIRELKLATELNKNELKQLIQIQKFAQEKEPEILQRFGNYTLHDLAHFDQVAQNLDHLLAGVELIPRERFCLIATSYCHDLGMANTEASQALVLSSRAEARRHHAELSEHLVHSERLATIIQDEGLRQVIGRVCAGHGRSDLDAPDFDDQYGIRVRFLAAVLSLADALDLRHDRRNPKTLKGPKDLLGYSFLGEGVEHEPSIADSPELADLSRVHWLRHYYSVLPSIQGSDPVQITLHARTQQADERQHLIAEIIQSDVLELLDREDFQNAISGILNVKLKPNPEIQGPVGWTTHVQSTVDVTKMTFPHELVGATLSGGLVRAQTIELPSRDSYYAVRIEPFMVPGELQVSISWLPSTLAPKSSLVGLGKSRVDGAEMVKELAKNVLDYVIWPIEPYLAHLRMLLNAGETDDLADRSRALVDSLTQIWSGQLLKYYLLQEGGMPPKPVTATRHIAKHGHYDFHPAKAKKDGFNIKQSLLGGRVEVRNQKQMAEFNRLCTYIGQVLEVDTDDDPQKSLSTRASSADAYQHSLHTVRVILDRFAETLDTTSSGECSALFNQVNRDRFKLTADAALNQLLQKEKSTPIIVDYMQHNDIPSVLALEQAASAFSWKLTESFVERIEGCGAFAVRTITGSVVGYLLIKPTDEKTLLLEKMAVHPGHQRQGVGLAIMTWVTSFAICSYSTLDLHVRKSNSRAIGLYEKCGFTRKREIAGYYKVTGDSDEDKTGVKMVFVCGGIH